MDDKLKDMVHWQDIKYSPIKIDPRMLLPNGLTILRKCFLKGENTHQAISKKRWVTYDRSFVVYAVFCMLKPLLAIKEVNFKEVMEEVLFLLKQDEENTV
ncbi:MAG: hypothetical protein AAFO04_25385 [Cyanobacteria bacterium J06592_8]